MTSVSSGLVWVLSFLAPGFGAGSPLCRRFMPRTRSRLRFPRLGATALRRCPAAWCLKIPKASSG